ncbi:MAG: UvrD-helicase domain-containing protein, partial [Flavobacteriales bacterium]|nr:UvrD-helicase domain-containing protein [Flavobacteriales bacterium]
MAEERNFVVYRASAGSGKTWVLVKEYLKLCLQYDSPAYYRSILAVTFTNKAASEMRERIMLRLQGFAGLNPKEFDAHMEKELCAELHLDKVELGRRSRNTLSHMLHHYSDLKISTIDSFVHQLVRAFARDIDVAPDFDIELDSDLVVQIAVDNVLDRVGRDPETTDMLLRYAKTMLEDEKNWNFRNDLADFASGLTVEGTSSKVAQLKKFEGHQFVEIHKQLSGLSAAFEKELTTVTQQALDLLASAQLDADAFSGKTLYNYIVELNQLNAKAMGKDLATFDKVLFGGEEFFPKSKAKRYADAFAPIDQELRGYCLKIHHLLKEEPYSHYLRVKKVRAQVYPLAVLHLVNDAINDWKDQNNTLLIGDFNRLINQVILNNPAPFIYERIGQRFRHFLIDEFQDTSIVQWQNFIPLLENSLATHHFNLIVGDGKQSIYRWRGGEVDQFNLLPDIYKKPPHIFDNAEAAFHREIDVRPREQNFRSAPEVVDFNNRLFDVIAPMLGDHASVYAGHRQEPVKSFKGWVTYEKPEKKKVFDAIEDAIRL